MILCLVTDRRRLGRAMGRQVADCAGLLIEQIGGAVAGGVDFVQVREPDLDAGELLGLIRRIIANVPAAAARLLVNDRLDVAMAGGAAGVHLKENSFTVGAARTIAPPWFVIGQAVHGPTLAPAHQDAAYLMAGTICPTPSKPLSRYLGFDGLAGVVAAAGMQPVVAIGGLSLSNAALVAKTGATGLAAIGAFIPDGDLDLGPYVQNQAEKLRLVFDSAVRVT